MLFFGWVLGPTLMGVYLFTTLNLYRPRVAISAFIGTLFYLFLIFAMWLNTFFNIFLMICITSLVIYFSYKCTPLWKLFLHSNEAFSSLREQQYKGFLRFKITAERLEAFFIGIDEIPEKWVAQDPNKAEPKWKEVNKEITPKLVDYWTVETPSKSSK